MSTRLSAGHVPAIYQFIMAHQYQFSVETMCRLLEVTRSGYYEFGGTLSGLWGKLRGQ